MKRRSPREGRGFRSSGGDGKPSTQPSPNPQVVRLPARVVRWIQLDRPTTPAGWQVSVVEFGLVRHSKHLESEAAAYATAWRGHALTGLPLIFADLGDDEPPELAA